MTQHHRSQGQEGIRRDTQHNAQGHPSELSTKFPRAFRHSLQEASEGAIREALRLPKKRRKQKIPEYAGSAALAFVSAVNGSMQCPSENERF